MKLDAVGSLDWDKGNGLLPAVVQHADDGRMLMLGFMNREALRNTLTERRVTFFSRSRQALWTKGETSGNYLEVVSVSADCDRDTLLVLARPAGPVCHTGSATCFPEATPPDVSKLGFLAKLEQVISDRIARSPEGSYTAELFSRGPHRIAQKIGEEGVEVALAAVGDDDQQVVAESADLIYHLLLLLRQRGLSLADIASELELRHADRRPAGQD
jgi:phosphoribosyl-ATP pyrophosphohydrolase/phosphoribosyl-AMP cyclohydrolase